MGKNTRRRAGDRRRKSIANYTGEKKVAQCKILIIYGQKYKEKD